MKRILFGCDGKEPHHDTLHRLGIEVADKNSVIGAFGLAAEFGATVETPPRTAWKGTPLHELRLEDRTAT